MVRSLPQTVEPGERVSALIQLRKVSGLWKAKTGRLRASGSRRLVKRVSTPVLS